MEKQNLYHIQDSDRPMWVISSSWSGALAKWKQKVAVENEMMHTDVDEPQGIQLVCQHDELIT